MLFLRKLPFDAVDLYTGQVRCWHLMALSEQDGDSQVERFLLEQLDGGEIRAAQELLAFLDSMVFDAEGPRRWIGSKRCHESVAGQQIYEFRQGSLRVHWFYGEGRCVAILARAVVKKSNTTPKPLAKELIRLKSAYENAVKAGAITVVEKP